MKEKSPEPYKNLRYADYPEKNRSQVNALALQNATAKDVRKKLADEVNEQIQPKVDEQTAGKDPLVREGIRKAVEKSVEQAVDTAVDAAVKKIDLNAVEEK